MKPAISGLNYLSERDAGTCWEYTFTFHDQDPAGALRQLLAVLSPEYQVLVPDPGPGDCFLEARKTQHAFEIKRGCHGSYGTWREASQEEAFAWLLPGAKLSRQYSSCYCTLDIPKS